MGNEKFDNSNYDDIIDMPHHVSSRHPHMSMHDRAAQFAPFAALSGHKEKLEEAERVVNQSIELDESVLEILNHKLMLISDVIDDGINPLVTITYFVPDKSKPGGEYRTIEGIIKKVDTTGQKIIITNSNAIFTIDMKSITEIHGELVDYIDEM